MLSSPRTVLLGVPPARRRRSLLATALRQPFLLASLLFFSVAGVAAIGVLLEASIPLLCYTAVTIFLVLLLGVYVIRKGARGELDFFELPVAWGAIVIVTFGLGGLQLFLHPEFMHPVFLFEPHWLPLALASTAVGLAALFFGYSNDIGVFFNRFIPHIVQRSRGASPSIRPLAVAILCGLGWAARLYLIEKGWIGIFKSLAAKELSGLGAGIIQPVRMVEYFCFLSLVLFLLDHFSHPRDLPRRLLAYGALGAELGWGILSGLKSVAVLPIVAYLVVYYYKRGKFPYKAALTSVLFVVFLYPVVAQYRAFATREVSISGQDPVSVLLSLPRFFSEGYHETIFEPNPYTQGSLRAAGYHTTLVQDYALILRYLDAGGSYSYGRDFILLPAIILIPRAIWPDKPVQDKAVWVAVRLWGQNPDYVDPMPPTYFGSLHLELGLPAVVLGMFGTGVFFRFLYERYGRPRTDYSLFVYVLLLQKLTYIEGDYVYMLGDALKTWAVILLVSIIVFRFRRHPAAALSVGGTTAPGQRPTLAGSQPA
ncbi:MAG TPA: hypothetical protein VNN18_09220 [Candidatus Xenobia bacterium]|nr:hypothetical protein [Candidatus Xenobia bacterium]